MAVIEEIIRFERHDRARVVQAMRELIDRGDGEGWINLEPSLSNEEAMRVPARSGLAAWFSGRGPAVAMATWTPPVTRGRQRAAQIGLAHGTGPNALPRLLDQGFALPPGWTKRQDHAKHGIVADLPSDGDLDAVLGWLLAAAASLMTIAEAGERWTAVVHKPS